MIYEPSTQSSSARVLLIRFNLPYLKYTSHLPAKKVIILTTFTFDLYHRWRSADPTLSRHSAESTHSCPGTRARSGSFISYFRSRPTSCPLPNQPCLYNMHIREWVLRAVVCCVLGRRSIVYVYYIVFEV